MDVKDQSCANCHFWRPVGKEQLGELTGCCCFNPPAVLITNQFEIAVVSDKAVGVKPISISVFPKTRESRWCGKWVHGDETPVDRALRESGADEFAEPGGDAS